MAEDDVEFEPVATSRNETVIVGVEAAAYDALAESHAELVAALEALAIKHLKSSWAGHFPSCAAVTHKRDAPPCSPRCAAAQSALTKARKL